MIEAWRSLFDRFDIDPHGGDAEASLLVRLAMEQPEFKALRTEGRRAFEHWMQDTAILAAMDHAEDVAHREAVMADTNHPALVRAVTSLMERSDLSLEGAARAILSERRVNEPSLEALRADIEKAMNKPRKRHLATVAEAARVVNKASGRRRTQAPSLEKAFLRRKRTHHGDPPLPNILQLLLHAKNTLSRYQARRKDGSLATNPDGSPLMLTGMEIGDLSEARLARVRAALKALLSEGRT